ncbi:MAG: hypothetical protein IKK64_07380 [Bacteroidales bacterium]|nr:hypothetical protein [Bacteroidales bacterium]
MKKFLFSLTMLAAVALAGFTTSCGGDDDGSDNTTNNGGVTPSTEIVKVFNSDLNVKTGMPGEDLEDLGVIKEDVNIKLYTATEKLDLSINGLNLGSLNNIPEPLQTPFDIILKNVPFTKEGDNYKIEYELPINEETLSTDVAIKIQDNNAYLVSLIGTISGDNINVTIFVVGDEELLYIPVNIFVEGTENK